DLRRYPFAFDGPGVLRRDPKAVSAEACGAECASHRRYSGDAAALIAGAVSLNLRVGALPEHDAVAREQQRAVEHETKQGDDEERGERAPILKRRRRKGHEEAEPAALADDLGDQRDD